jgi:hypothetical protein
MAGYHEFRFWSPMLGCEALRLSVTGGAAAAQFHGRGVVTQEYFAIIPAHETGRKYRDRRNAALDAIDAAIAAGREPGEVVSHASTKGTMPPAAGKGRRKGVPNKLSADVKAMILGALDAKGGQAWLEQQMDKNPAPFLALLGKILPMQVSGADDGPIIIKWIGHADGTPEPGQVP